MRVIAAIQGGDLDALLDAYADDGIYRVAGNNVVSGNYQGHEAIRDFFIHLVPGHRGHDAPRAARHPSPTTGTP